MISSSDRTCIIETAKRYGAVRVVLFGSSTNSNVVARDIDLGVEGVSPSLFFRFYGELIVGLSTPVDVVDLGIDSLFTRLVRREGTLLYGHA
jgi:predicted nucleotidyltransferase